MSRVAAKPLAHLLLTLTLCLAAAALTLPGAARAESITGREVMERSKKANQSTRQVTDIHMLLIDKKGKEQVRAVKIWAVQTDEVDNTLTRFTEPKDVAGVGFLVAAEGGDSKRWLYMPASKKTRMIAEGDKDKPFMGTDFTYYDLSPHDLDNEVFDPVASEDLDGIACYKVGGRSKHPEKSEYGKVIKWVRKDNYVPIRIDFYDKDGKLLKRSTVLELKQIGGNWTPMKTRMHNVKIDHQTVMTVQNVEYDVEIPDRYFTKSHLERGR